MIIFFILMTLMYDSGMILLGEMKCLSLGMKRLILIRDKWTVLWLCPELHTDCTMLCLQSKTVHILFQFLCNFILQDDENTPFISWSGTQEHTFQHSWTWGIWKNWKQELSQSHIASLYFKQFIKLLMKITYIVL